MNEKIFELSLNDGVDIVIIYNSDGKITKRRILVYNIFSEKIHAYCYLRKKKRTFLKENILAVEIYEKN